MSKIDLIIDVLELIENIGEWKTEDLCNALAAARELKALQPVAYLSKDGLKIELSVMTTEYMKLKGCTPLYALDEVTK